ncbi:hypothetical protein CLV62_13715 [Dysgonomonas alginatilytica]|uniref:Uncharacterized protein n=1 Tax=Dysgonomonas alginatilytica TaxID=1605892 RepID=A0A2V3PKC4_9BACT|nr:hypothetical protein [Dysgonomonas alginatilytica]PXV59349.1 hypothetical protein CLV62_13715 [Dysgonomonas alginatilytica]
MEKIELRSEKVRNIIGKIPPYIIRSGITLIIILSLLILVNCSFITIPVFADCEVIIEKQNEKLIIEKIRIKNNINLNDNIKKGSPLILSLNDRDICLLAFDSDIAGYLISSEGIYISNLNMPVPNALKAGDTHFSIENSIILKGKIELKRISLLSSFFNRI